MLSTTFLGSGLAFSFLYILYIFINLLFTVPDVREKKPGSEALVHSSAEAHRNYTI